LAALAWVRRRLERISSTANGCGARLAASTRASSFASPTRCSPTCVLLAHQDKLQVTDLLRYADELGLDVDRLGDDVKRHVNAARVARDVETADLSGVSGTPTFFINGERHYGAYDIDTLTRAAKTARARAIVKTLRSGALDPRASASH
jgi:glutaredoxin